jgi:ABC-type branched-subunit amino acid transport system permease subunit
VSGIGTVASTRFAPVRAFFRRHRSLGIAVGVLLISVALPLITHIPPFDGIQSTNAWVNAFTTAAIYAMLAMGLNIVIGFAGLLDLGYAAFFALGGYAYAFVAAPYTGVHLPFWPMLLAGGVVGAIFGILLGAPTLRLRGDYLAIVTLGFGEIVPITLMNSDKFTNGVNGISGIDKPSIPGILQFTLINPWPMYALAITLFTLIMIMIFRLQDSRLGRTWDAIREDELAAESSGVNIVIAKLQAFAVGASIAGIVGVVNAAKLTIVTPDQFRFSVSISVLAAVVLGGMGNTIGVATGAFIIYLFQNILLKQINTLVENFNIPVLSTIDFLQFQYVLYGIVLVLMMLKRPQGIFPARRRMREFAPLKIGKRGVK